MLAVLSIWFLSLLGAPKATVLPDDSDEVVLLQAKFRTRSKHASTSFQEPLELTQENMAAQLDSIHEFLQKQPSDDDDDADDGDGDSNGDGGVPPSGNAGEEVARTVRQMLESQMETFLVGLHASANNDWQAATTLSTACGAHRERRFDNTTGDVVLAERAVHQARLKHKACRQSEQGWNTFHTMSYSPPANLGVHNVDAAAIAFSQAVTRAQSLAQTYNGISPAGMHECLVDQMSFEMSSCTWAAKAKEACNAYATCITGVGLADLRNRLLVDSSARRSLWRTIGVLKCRIDQMMKVGSSDEGNGTTNVTDPCADLVVSTAHLVLTLQLPPSDDCTDEQLPPLTGPSTEDSTQCVAWMGSEYTWDPSDAVLPDACAATCVGVHRPQPPSDCEDATAQCQFYQQHPSACGSFLSTVGFDACTDCCYCSFSPACGHCPPGYIVHQGGTACQECPEGQIPAADGASCVDPQPCAAIVDCSGHGTTDDLDKSDGCSCSCGGGYSGVDCSTPPPCDATVDCSGHGATTDLDNTNGCDCACDDGFEGADCATQSNTDASLVVFDQFAVGTLRLSRITVTPGAVSVYGQGTANSDHQVSADDSICGVAFKCNTGETHGHFGLAHEYVNDWRLLDYAIACEGTYQAFTMPVVDSWGMNDAIQFGRPRNGNPTSDVHALRINADGQVEYSLNGNVYYTSSVAVRYPWHVAVSVHPPHRVSSNYADVHYLQC